MTDKVIHEQDWRKEYPLVEFKRQGWTPLVRCLRLSLYFYSLSPRSLWWYAVNRWPLWCRVFPHAWTSYGCPTCPTYCARMCRTLKEAA